MAHKEFCAANKPGDISAPLNEAIRAALINLILNFRLQVGIEGQACLELFVLFLPCAQVHVPRPQICCNYHISAQLQTDCPPRPQSQLGLNRIHYLERVGE